MTAGTSGAAVAVLRMPPGASATDQGSIRSRIARRAIEEGYTLVSILEVTRYTRRDEATYELLEQLIARYAVAAILTVGLIDLASIDALALRRQLHVHALRWIVPEPAPISPASPSRGGRATPEGPQALPGARLRPTGLPNSAQPVPGGQPPRPGGSP